MSWLRSAALCLCVLTTLLNGCVANRIYRPGACAIQTAPKIAGATEPSPFKLGIVEFDDMGESWEKCSSLAEPDTCQLSRVLDLIRREKQRTGEVVVVVFIHGWKNNASPANEDGKNLRDFKLLMGRLGRHEPVLASRRQLRANTAVAARSYIGVYMAWRGQSVANNVFTTFWNRRDAAQRVGSSDFAEALFRIMGATKENSPESRVVVVGHSFGARVLETAITNSFISLLIPPPTQPLQDETVVSPADLIVYVNPATDSFRTKQMIELMKRTQFRVSRGAEKIEPPLFVSVTSTGDTATGTAFPLGQDLSAMRKSFRSGYGNSGATVPSQKVFFTRTPGHIPFLFSHVVQQFSGPCISQSNLLRFQARGDCYQMSALPQRWNDTAFWVTTVPPGVIRNHVDIFNDGFVAMITGLLEQYEVLDSPHSTRMLRAR